MRLAFFGTSAFAVPALRALVSAGHSVNPVVTAPPKPSGRGRRLEPSPVEAAAAGLGLEVSRPAGPNDPGFVAALCAGAPELAVLVAYGAILGEELLAIPRRGFLNLHPSLLPAYRGAAPIQRALFDGVAETGVSVIAMSRRVDAGDVVRQERVTVGPDETAGELGARLAEIGARLIVEAVAAAGQDRLARLPQDEALATRAPKIEKRDRALDWSRPAVAIHNRVRALSPEPGAVTVARGRPLVILRTRRSADPAGAEPGTLLTAPGRLLVATGTERLELVEVKPAGGRPMPAAAFANGLRPEPGEKLQ